MKGGGRYGVGQPESVGEFHMMLREEGLWLVAYFAPHYNRTVAPVELGRIRAHAARSNDAIKKAFTQAMKMVVAEAIANTSPGVTIAHWEDMPPPDSERT